MNVTTLSSEIWISAQDAASLLHINPSTVVNRIRSGKLIGRLESIRADGTVSSDPCFVLLNSLPQEAQQRFLESKIPRDRYVSMDILSIFEKHGSDAQKQYLRYLPMLAEASEIRRMFAGEGTVTAHLGQLAKRYGISLRSLYRMESTPQYRTASPLFQEPFYLSKHLPKTACLLCADLIYTLWLDPDHRLSHNSILRSVQELSLETHCAECPYRPGTETRTKLSAIQVDYMPECRLKRDHMLIPNNRHVVNRLLAHIPEQQLCYCRESVRAWRARFGHFAVREKPLYVNACFQGDHHVFDLMVDHELPDKHGKLRHYLIRPVLTAWMDTASGCIVGWVISFLPNADTIADAFSRAVVFTVGEEFAGLPTAIYVDHGKDYSAALLQDLDHDFRDVVHESECLNASLVGNAFFPALNVRVYQAKPYHPQSKSIERFFGTLESRYIATLNGWCGSNPTQRPPDFLRKMHRLQSEGKLFTMRAFVQYFAAVILPDYHQTVQKDAADHLSPIERYRSLPKARDLIPSWKTMAILKSHRDYYTVQRQGIRCQGMFYWADELDTRVGSRALVYFSDALPPISITVLLNGSYLCEAFPVQKLPFIGAEADQLQLHLDEQARQQKKMQAAVTRLKLPIRLSGLDKAISDKQLLRMEAYGQAVDDDKDHLAANLLPKIPDDAPTPSGTYSSETVITTEEYTKLQQLLNPLD